ncbi:HAD family hydrolase [Streptomyces sp. NPDC001889]
MIIRTVALDIGETLTRDDRYWTAWADWIGVPGHTLAALVGAVVAQGRDNADALRLLRPGIDVRAEYEARELSGCGEQLGESDLYDDVRPALGDLRALGVRVVVAGNQTVKAGRMLRALDIPADLVVASGEWGVAKPEPGFFERLLQVADAEPHETLYVGDHPANDVHPAKAAGLRTAHLRRGPWGHLWADDPAVRDAADWSVNSLHDLVAVVADVNRTAPLTD